ncbi:MAG: NADP-dependent phosphogluconate dehydrogenase [bacterium]
MSESLNDIGMIGLAVMGRNLVLNMADRGFAVAAYNRTDSVTREFAAELDSGQRVEACYSLEQFVGSLEKPRRAMIMVKAGKPVDAVIAALEPLLAPGDVLVDGGNSYFRDTERREKSLAAVGIHFFGVGISGGEFGARTGPSMMPGGPQEAYQSVRAIFEAIAARADGEPCVSYLGPGATGHYVKMVHNGIEYGFMQLIAETYALMKEGLGLSNEELADVYAEWDGAELNSYLLEITSNIFKQRDEKTGGHLVDLIRGEAGQLGTGMWTSQSAMDLQVPAPNIDVAVAMRNLSALEDQRRAATTLLGSAVTGGDAASGASPHSGAGEGPRLTAETVRDALYAAMVMTYAQGFAQLQVASKALGFGLHLEDVASVWRGGCIIRSALLRDIKAAFQRQPELPNLLLDPELSRVVVSRRDHLVRAVEAGASAGVAVPGLMTALAYLDAYRAEWLPSNLIQAQRDYFGAHTYHRVDGEGIFHTDWLAGQDGA